MEFFNGQPALPTPLRAALTEVCPQCGHAELIWLGPISTLVEQLAMLTAKRDPLKQQLDAVTQEREPVLST